MKNVSPRPNKGDRVRCNLSRYAGWVTGTVEDIEKSHALVSVDCFSHPVYVNFADMEVVR